MDRNYVIWSLPIATGHALIQMANEDNAEEPEDEPYKGSREWLIDLRIKQYADGGHQNEGNA